MKIRLALLGILFLLSTGFKNTETSYYYGYIAKSGSKTVRFSAIFSSTCSFSENQGILEEYSESNGYEDHELQGPFTTYREASDHKTEAETNYKASNYWVGGAFTPSWCK